MLSAASRKSHEQVAQLLLEKGADVHAKNGIFGYALSSASITGHGGVVRLLLRYGVDVNADDGTHGLALSVPSRDGHEEVVRLLLERGPRSTLKTNCTETRWLQHRVLVRRRWRNCYWKKEPKPMLKA